MLAGTGLRNDPGFTHPLYQKTLTHDIVDFVGSGVVQVFSLDVNAGSSEVAG
jgi:hypothetical protein